MNAITYIREFDIDQVGIITELGGIDAAIKHLKYHDKFKLFVNPKLKQAIIDYKNIGVIMFKSGQKVVLDNDDQSIYEISHYSNLGNGYIMKCGNTAAYSLVKRLATKEEIAANHRLDGYLTNECDKLEEMRIEFEKLPEVKDSLGENIVFVGNKYTTANDGFYDLVNWLNGAWYAFQHRQTEVDDLETSNLSRAGHIDRLQKHNAKLQQRLRENGLEWKDLIEEHEHKGNAA